MSGNQDDVILLRYARLLFLKSIRNQRKGLKLYPISMHTSDNTKFKQRIAEVNDFRENLPIAVINVYKSSLTTNSKRHYRSLR